MVAGVFIPLASPALAQPAGGNVVSGQATISQPSVYSTLITQSSAKAIIDWQNFSVANGQSVQFAQPNASSVTLNRVTGGTLSSIQGSITANGQVWLINPNGVMFGRNANVNVGGLLATTSDINNADFLSGNYVFNNAPSGSAVVNHGTINASTGGSVVLSAPRVSNRGVITAHAGHVVLGSAEAFTVDFNGDRLLSYAVKTPAGSDTSKTEGTVAMTPRAAAQVQRDVVNDTGMAEATHARVENGEVILDGDAPAGVTNSGKIDVAGKAPGQVGGTAELLGKTVSVTDGAKVDASGDAGGGTVLIGGNLHGAGPQPNAKTVTVDKATISADAVTTGNGGTVAIYSTGKTKVAAAISAQGGAQGGNGGQVETSGESLEIDDLTTVNTAAIRGSAGDWLLDPGTINIATGGTTQLDSNHSYTFTTDPSTTDTVTIAPSTITTALGSGSVTLEATSAITVSNDVIYNSSNNLVLLSKGTIAANASIQNAGSGSITLTAGWDGVSAAAGQAAAGSYGLGNSMVSIGGNYVAVGGAGATYVNAYGLTISNTGATGGYGQLGYHSNGGGNINVQTGAGGVVVTDAYGETSQIGNGGYDNTIVAAATGNITINTTGTTLVSNSIGTATIGNYAGTYGESGNVTLTTGTLSSSGNQVFGASTLITRNIGTGAGTGGDVTLATTAGTLNLSSSAIYNSSHNVVLLSKSGINVSNASIQNAGSGSITLTAGWDGVATTSGAAAANTYGLTSSGTITLSGNVAAVGGAGGPTYINAYGLNLAGSSGPTGNSYEQIGYHGAGGSGINIQTLAGGVVVQNRAAGSAVQIGNGGYDGNIAGAATGDITISTTGATSVSTAGGTASIGNYAGTPGESGNVTLNTGTLTSSGTVFDVNTLITNNIGTTGVGTGGDVSVSLTNATATTTINALSYNSPHLASVTTNNTLTFAGAINNAGTGSLSFFSQSGSLSDTFAIHTNGSLSITSFADATLSGALTIGGATTVDAGGVVTATNTGNILTGPVYVTTSGGSGTTPQINIVNNGNLLINRASVSLSNGSAGAISLSTLSGDVTVAGVIRGQRVTISSAGNIVEGSLVQGQANLPTPGSISATDLDLVASNGNIGSTNGPIQITAGNVYLAGNGATLSTLNNLTGIYGSLTLGNSYHANAVQLSGDLGITSNGATQTAAIVASNVNIALGVDNAGTGNPITLTNAGNQISGTVNAAAYGGFSSPYQIAISNSGTLKLGDVKVADSSGDGNHGSIHIITLNNGDLQINGRLEGGQIMLDAAGSVIESGAGLIFSHRSGDDTSGGDLTMNIGGAVTLNGANIIETADGNGVLAEGELNFLAGGNVDVHLSNNNVALFGVNTSNGYVSIVLDGTTSGGTSPNLDIFNSISATGRITLHAAGDITQQQRSPTDPNILQDPSIITPLGLSATSDNGNLNLGDGGSIDGFAGAGNKIGGDINGYSVLNAPNGNATFTNTMDTILGGLAFFNPNSTPTFPATGTPTPQPQNYTSPDSYIYGNLTVNVTDANEASGHAVLVLAGRIHAQNHNGGNATLTASGDIDNNSGDGTLIAGYTDSNDNGVNTNLVLNSINGSIGGNDGTSWSFGLGADSGTLNLQALAPSGGVTINPGAVNFGITGNSGPAVQAATTLTVYGNGIVTQNSDLSGVINASDVGISGVGNITLNNPYNAVTRTAGFQTPGDIVFANSTDVTVNNASDGLNSDNRIVPAASLIVTVQDPNHVNSPVLHIGQSSYYYTDTNNASQTINNSINVTNGVTLTAAGGITDDYSPANGDAGWILAQGTVNLNTASSAISLTNPLNLFAALNANSQGGDIAIAASGPVVGTTAPNGRLLIGTSGINAGGGVLNLTVNNTSLVQDADSGAIAAASLIVATNGSGTFIDLRGSGNAIGGSVSLSADGDVHFINSVDTFLDSNASTSGMLDLESLGNLTINSGAVLTAGQVGDGAVVLSAANAFINNAGSDAINFTDGGAFQIYSNSPYDQAENFGGLDSGNTAVWSAYVGNGISVGGNRYGFHYAPTLTVTSTNVTKTQGQDATAAVAAAYTVTGLDQGMAGVYLADSLSGTPSVTSVGSAAGAATGPYQITVAQGGLDLQGYNFDPESNGVLTVNAAGNMPTLYYVADPFTRTYGSANPIFTGTVTGFQNGDTLSSSTTGTAVWASSAAQYSNVGQYAILGSGLSSGTYQFAQAQANYTALTINAALLSYVADATSKIYGDANPVLGGTTTGYLGNDTQANATTGTYLLTTSATTSSGVGSYAITGSGLSATNYVFQQAATNATALTINPATLTYVASATARAYGAANPVFGGTVTGFVNGDTLSTATSGTLAFNSTATTASGVGSYAILGSGLSARNYTFVQAGGNSTALVINPATLTYIAAAATKTYGDTNPTFGGTVTGFVNGDTQSTATSGTLAFNSTATTASGVGSYAILGSGLSARNYTFVQAGGNSTALAINPATLTYVAATETKTYGAANPIFGGAVTGFVNGDTQQSATTGTLVFASSATTGTNVGSYAINGSGLSATNYVFVQKAGNTAAFTINPATLTAALTGTVDKKYDGTTLATLSAANYAPLVGVIGTDKVALASYPTSGSYNSATAGTGKTVTVTGLTLSGAAAGNYALASSTISAPIGVIEQTVLTSNPGLLSVVTGNPQAFAILQTASTTTPFVAPSNPTGPTLTQTQTVELAALANPNPIAALASPDPSDTSPPELPTPIETAITFIVDSMDGKAPASAQGNDIIPGLLTTAPGQTPPPPGTGENLSAWGNPSLWQ